VDLKETDWEVKLNQDYSIGNVKYSDYAATPLIFVHNSGQLLYYYDMTHEQFLTVFYIHMASNTR
jgi:hypothetical protein